MVERAIGSANLIRQLGAWRGGGSVPSYRKLADGLRLLVLDGRLAISSRLPGERELAAALQVSRTTVAAAYALLREQGYLDSRRGSGSRVSLPCGAGGQSPGLLADDGRAGMIDFGAASMPAGEAVHRAYVAAIEALPAHLPGHGYEPVGLPELRAVIARRYCARGVPTAPEQILVTNGAQHALALLLRLLTGPGDRVVVDHPTYPHAIEAIRQASCLPVPVGLAPGGWDPDAILAAFRQSGPRFAYLVPDFNNPTGLCMDAPARRAIAAAAAETRTLLVVDEAIADLWLDAPPPPPFAAFAPEWTISLGSTGKSFWGGLRVGWIRADEQTVSALKLARSSLDLGSPVLEQLAVASLLESEQQPLEERRAILRARRAALLALVADKLPDWRVPSPPGGVSLWAEMPSPVSTRLAAIADAEGVRITAGPRFGVGGAFERFVRLPYTLPEPRLAEGVERLARAYARLRLPFVQGNVGEHAELV